MGMNASQSELVRIRRRQIVQSLLVRRPGITQREIHAHLAGVDNNGDPRIVNPNTGKPFSLGTINGDVQTLREGWKALTAEANAEWRARFLVTCEEIEKAAWATGDLRMVRQVWKDRREALGLDEPDRWEVSGPGGGPIEHQEVELDLSEYSDEELLELRRLLGKAMDDDSGA